ncbi:hypothetical protein SCOR_02590 [Sulfidibacter corallicola]|uniref:Uncharacterized protein n=1 Tax=Sulfidibacter corallicola TaxID=2818388 RepID=A0A8A4TH99_SULCO|nr:hypothetical protein [Sulfidibacter corallicola]QTD48584.1 hypothetical protein J3U87_23635 [Sulfidibacter corallicola]
MELQELIQESQEILDQIDELNRPISDVISSHNYQKEISNSMDGNADLEMGSFQYSGAYKVSLHLTKTDEAPIEVFEAEADEHSFAYASLLLEGKAGAGLAASIPLGSVDTQIGAKANAQVQIAFHRRFPQSENGIEALRTFLQELKHPFGAPLVRQLAPSEVLQVNFSGGVSLSAVASWQYGITKEFDLSEDLDLTEAVGFEAAIAAQVALRAGLEGQFKFLVEPSSTPPETPQHSMVRVQLFKKKSGFLGAGFGLNVGFTVSNVDHLIDKTLAKALKYPDEFLDKIRAASQDLDALQNDLNNLSGEVKDTLSEWFDKAFDELGLDDIQNALDRLDELPAEVQQVLAPFSNRVEAVVDTLEEERQELTETVDDFFTDTLETIAKPIDRVQQKIQKWLDGYEEMKARIKKQIVERAEQGISAELRASINRTSTSEALLDIDFELPAAADVYQRVVRGDVAAAIDAHRTGQSVWIRGGSLTKTTRIDRHQSLKLNFFGFKLNRDLKRFDQIEYRTDGVDGTMSIFGQAGAALQASTKRRQTSLAFVMDLAVPVAAPEGLSALTPDTITADLQYEVILTKDRAIEKIMPIQIQAASDYLGLMDQAQADELLELLEKKNGDYHYRLSIGFPKNTMESLFLLGPMAALSDKDVTRICWAKIRESLRASDLEISGGGTKVYPFSALILQPNIDHIMRFPHNFRQAIVGPRLSIPTSQRLSFWSHMNTLKEFIDSYIGARKALARSVPPKRLNRKLSYFAAKLRKPVGSAGTKPIGAKYLMLVALVGPTHLKIHAEFKRGDSPTFDF